MLWSRLKSICKSLGLTEISYLVHAVPLGLPERMAESFCRSTIDPGWVLLYDSGRWIYTDPVMHAAARQLEPVIWERFEVGRDFDELPPSRQAMVRAAQDYGYSSGVCCPMHGPAGVFATFSVLSRMPAADFRSVWQSENAEILRLARCLHTETAQSVTESLSPDLLTPKEQQVLSAASRGFAAKVIASQLGCSRFTVEKHLANARNKLQARDTTHAVSLALTRGLIWPNGYRTRLPEWSD